MLYAQLYESPLYIHFMIKPLFNKYIQIDYIH